MKKVNGIVQMAYDDMVLREYRDTLENCGL